MERWNPDQLIGRHGYALYGRMLQDDQIRALLALKQAVITSRSWRFRSTGRNPLGKRCAEFFQFMVEKSLAGTFKQALGNLLSSQAYGFSLVEKVYSPLRWKGRDYWGVTALKLRPAETFTFKMDPHGNRTAILQEQAGRQVALDPGRFIHYVNKPEAHPLYGESDLRECHRHWWAKDNILKFWNIYLERMAAGFVHGKISGPLSASERDELKQVIRNLSAQTAVITPANVELEVVSSPSTDAFERAVAARDKAMAKALLVPNLLGFSEQGSTGSYSQSKIQLETFFFVLNALAESIADTMNEQLFQDLARWNFGLEEPPVFVFDPLTDQQKADTAKAWQAAVSGGIATHTSEDEERVRDLLGFSRRKAMPALPEANGAARNTEPQPSTDQ